MRVGNSPPRRWVEGEVCLFDDSFEHEVWNRTSSERIVLIVDLWHPELTTSEARAAVLDKPRRKRYEALLAGEPFESVPATSPRENEPSFFVDVVPVAASRDEGPGGVTRHCQGLHSHVLGARGMEMLGLCVSAMLDGGEAEWQRQLQRRMEPCIPRTMPVATMDSTERVVQAVPVLGDEAAAEDGPIAIAAPAPPSGGDGPSGVA